MKADEAYRLQTLAMALAQDKKEYAEESAKKLDQARNNAEYERNKSWLHHFQE